jgi:4-hydroxy-tetrahydrodipicolinate reductase
MKVGVMGALGRMGTEVCRAVEGADDLDLAARVDVDDPISDLVAAGAEVAVDFTTPAAVKSNISFCAENGIHIVVGTTGLTKEDLEEVADWTSRSEANVFVAPNFAIGAVLMMRFAAEAAPYFSSAEIVERHHERKLDAPSGTALRTAELMNAARSSPWIFPEGEKEAIPSSRGGDVEGVRIHALRGPGSVAHHEVVLGTEGQTLVIRHDSIDRSSFMPGVLLAIREVSNRRGLTVGLEHLLDL